jgi:hypothetical protein
LAGGLLPPLLLLLQLRLSTEVRTLHGQAAKLLEL